jgi:hypothetical protein
MKRILVAVLAVLAISCSDEKDGVNPNNSINADFSKSIEGWNWGFADYPEGVEEEWQFSVKQDTLPSPLDRTKKALRVSGSNHSDDLFMYITKKVTMPKANQSYEGTFEIDFATEAAEGSMGVGGSPAHSVYMGIGLVSVEPAKKMTDDGHYRMNISKISQSQDGEDMKVIGDVSNGKDDFVYTMVKRTGKFTGKTDANGNLWVIIGTDSGFEAVTTLYYTNVKVDLKEVN